MVRRHEALNLYWPIVYDTVPALTQYSFNISGLLEGRTPHNSVMNCGRWTRCRGLETAPQQAQDAGPMLAECWPSVYDIKPALVQRLVFAGTRHRVNQPWYPEPGRYWRAVGTAQSGVIPAPHSVRIAPHRDHRCSKTPQAPHTPCLSWRTQPSKHDTLNQCRFNVGPTSETAGQH